MVLITPRVWVWSLFGPLTQWFLSVPSKSEYSVILWTQNQCSLSWFSGFLNDPAAKTDWQGLGDLPVVSTKVGWVGKFKCPQLRKASLFLGKQISLILLPAAHVYPSMYSWRSSKEMSFLESSFSPRAFHLLSHLYTAWHNIE